MTITIPNSANAQLMRTRIHPFRRGGSTGGGGLPPIDSAAVVGRITASEKSEFSLSAGVVQNVNGWERNARSLSGPTYLDPEQEPQDRPANLPKFTEMTKGRASVYFASSAQGLILPNTAAWYIMVCVPLSGEAGNLTTTIGTSDRKPTADLRMNDHLVSTSELAFPSARMMVVETSSAIDSSGGDAAIGCPTVDADEGTPLLLLEVAAYDQLPNEGDRNTLRNFLSAKYLLPQRWAGPAMPFIDGLIGSYDLSDRLAYRLDEFQGIDSISAGFYEAFGPNLNEGVGSTTIKFSSNRWQYICSDQVDVADTGNYVDRTGDYDSVAHSVFCVWSTNADVTPSSGSVAITANALDDSRLVQTGALSVDGDTVELFAGAATGTEFTGEPLSISDQRWVGGFSKTSSDVSLFLNGEVNTGANTAATNAFPSVNYIGGKNKAFAGGQLFAALFFNRALTIPEANQVQDYLMSKYDVIPNTPFEFEIYETTGAIEIRIVTTDLSDWTLEFAEGTITGASGETVTAPWSDAVAQTVVTSDSRLWSSMKTTQRMSYPLASLPRGLESWECGRFSKRVGEVKDFPPQMYDCRPNNRGGSSTLNLSGDIADMPRYMRTYIQDGPSGVYGDISKMTCPLLTFFKVSGEEQMTFDTEVWPFKTTGFSRFTLNGTFSRPQSVIDRILRVADNEVLSFAGGRLIELDGANEEPTGGLSNLNVISLQSKGCTVVISNNPQLRILRTLSVGSSGSTYGFVREEGIGDINPHKVGAFTIDEMSVNSNTGRVNFKLNDDFPDVDSFPNIQIDFGDGEYSNPLFFTADRTWKCTDRNFADYIVANEGSAVRIELQYARDTRGFVADDEDEEENLPLEEHVYLYTGPQDIVALQPNTAIALGLGAELFDDWAALLASHPDAEYPDE